MKKALPVLLILIGIILVSIPLLTEQIIKHYNNGIAKEDITMEEIKSNIKINEGKEDIEFDFSVIQDIDIMSAIKGSMDFDRNLVIGILLIPDLDIDIPILCLWRL